MQKTDLPAFNGTIHVLNSENDCRYLAVPVSIKVLDNYLGKLQNILGDESYKQYTSSQIKRDEGQFHITIVDPIEMLKLEATDLKKIIGKHLTFNLIGLGNVVNDKNSSYFVVVESDSAQNLRKSIGLDNKDLHITIGFNSEDLYDVSKDRTTLLN